MRRQWISPTDLPRLQLPRRWAVLVSFSNALRLKCFSSERSSDIDIFIYSRVIFDTYYLILHACYVDMYFVFDHSHKNYNISSHRWSINRRVDMVSPVVVNICTACIYIYTFCRQPYRQQLKKLEQFVSQIIFVRFDNGSDDTAW